MIASKTIFTGVLSRQSTKTAEHMIRRVFRVRERPAISRGCNIKPARPVDRPTLQIFCQERLSLVGVLETPDDVH